jgi:hypothetical protein
VEFCGKEQARGREAFALPSWTKRERIARILAVRSFWESKQEPALQGHVPADAAWTASKSPTWLAYADLASSIAANHGQLAADVGMTARSALITSCRHRHDVMFSTARSASSVYASRTTTGTSAKPRVRAAATR